MGDWLPFLGGLIAAVLAFIGGLATAKANAQNINVQTIASLSKQLNDLVEDRRKDRELIDALQNRADDTDDLRDYVKEILAWLESNGIKDYPKPKKKDLLNTGKHKAIGK